jgi:hypothetical protein
VFGSMIAAAPRSRPTVPHEPPSVGEGVAETIEVGSGVDETDGVGEVPVGEGLILRETVMEVLP